MYQAAEAQKQQDKPAHFPYCQRISPVGGGESRSEKQDNREYISHPAKYSEKEPAHRIPDDSPDPEITDKQQNRHSQNRQHQHFPPDAAVHFFLCLSLFRGGFGSPGGLSPLFSSGCTPPGSR